MSPHSNACSAAWRSYSVGWSNCSVLVGGISISWFTYRSEVNIIPHLPLVFAVRSLHGLGCLHAGPGPGRKFC